MVFELQFINFFCSLGTFSSYRRDFNLGLLVVMFLLICVFYIFVSNSVNADSTQDASSYTHAGKNIKKNEGALGFYAALHSNPPPINVTFYEKDENQVRVPTKFYEEHKKKKKIKKSPKRTIQKIIKKGKNRSRKIYVNPITRLPTVPSQKLEVQDSDANIEESTTENHKKKYRKNPKVPRYPMPFHKLQQKPLHYRNKREIDRKDVFIIKDLDEMEFIDRGDDYDVIKTHVGKYW